MAQTQVTKDIAPAFIGSIWAQFPHEIQSMSCETPAGIAAGVAVSRGTDKDNQVVVGGADYLGIAVREVSIEGDTNNNLVYQQTDTVPVMRTGYVWASPVGAVTVGAPVDFDAVTGALTTGGGGTVITGATWEKAAAGGGLSVIRLA
jgi:hypothetical protein